MAEAIVTEKLTRYYGPKCVVNQLNLRVPEGCVYGFLGRNGAGKTTTIKMLLGFVQPDYGSATLLGQPSRDLPPETRARIAYLAENHPLYKTMRVGAMVDFTRAFYPTWNDTLLAQILDHFELSRKSRISSLSNGQKAQLSLALAVAPDPELLILDDPTLGLDTVVRRDFLESLVQIIQRKGRTILFSSHILGDVERLADRIGVLVDGVLRVDCTTDHFRATVRKVVAEFGAEPPTFPGCAKLVGSRPVGTTLELVFAGYGDEQQAAVEALGPKHVEVVPLNLEDAFIEYTRGPGRAMPILAVEKPR